MVSQTGTRVVRLNSCKGLNLSWKRAKGPNENFLARKCYLGPYFWNLAPRGQPGNPTHMHIFKFEKRHVMYSRPRFLWRHANTIKSCALCASALASVPFVYEASVAILVFLKPNLVYFAIVWFNFLRFGL